MPQNHDDDGKIQNKTFFLLLMSVNYRPLIGDNTVSAFLGLTMPSTGEPLLVFMGILVKHFYHLAVEIEIWTQMMNLCSSPLD